MTSADNDAWSLTFFFIPVGICLVVGLFFFGVSLTRLVFLAIRLRKIKEVIIPYVRMLLFVFNFFLVFALFCAYIINNAANAGTITNGYEAYYLCLSGSTPTPTSDCQLDGDVSNYPLVMLKGFAISCLGLLLFFTFLSWRLFYHWFKLFKAIFLVFQKRDKSTVMGFLYLVGSESKHPSSSTLAGASSLTMSPEPQDASLSTGQEEDDEENKEESADEESDSKQSSSSE